MLLLFNLNGTVRVIGVIEHCGVLLDFEQNQLLVVTSVLLLAYLSFFNNGCFNLF